MHGSDKQQVKEKSFYFLGVEMSRYMLVLFIYVYIYIYNHLKYCIVIEKAILKWVDDG